MSTKQMPLSEVVETIAQLDVQGYKAFLRAVNVRRAQQRPSVLSKEESRLLKKIYEMFPQVKKARIAELSAKIQTETLSKIEHAVLLELIEAQETWAAERLNNLAKLAALRNTDYASLLQHLGLSEPEKP